MSSEGDYSPPPPPPKKKKKKGDDDKDDSSRPHQPPDRSKSHRKSPPKLPDSSDGSNAGAIAGSIVGGALLLIVVVVLLVFCSTRGKRRRRRRKKSREDDSDSDDSVGDRDSYFRHDKKRNNSNPNPNPNPNTNTNDHLVKIPSQSGAVSGRMSSEYSWPMGRPPPPPPPPMMSSSELGSVSFMTSSSLRRPLPPIPLSPPLPPVPPSPPPPIALGLTQSSFSYDELVRATNGFAQSNLLGQGGFGYVYKGILPNGKEVAVKYLKMNNGQGERELQSEVEIISRVHHRHLVPLVGYCIAGSQRMLVYEFVSNDTLEFHLHGKGRPVMDWPIRLKIAIGAAKGFAYLHEDCHPRIIHRDIKAANILLDLNFEAKVADFGLAKLSQDNYTHVSTRIMGTFGYLAPEYASTGKLTEKSDVFSFGIVLLELITGRRPLDRLDPDDDGLVDRARPILNIATTGGSYEELVDQRLEYNYDPMEMRRMVHCAAACIRHSSRRRPKMSQIVNALQGNVSLDELDMPASVQGSAMNSRNNSEYDLRKLGGNSP